MAKHKRLIHCVVQWFCVLRMSVRCDAASVLRLINELSWFTSAEALQNNCENKYLVFVCLHKKEIKSEKIKPNQLTVWHWRNVGIFSSIIRWFRECVCVCAFDTISSLWLFMFLSFTKKKICNWPCEQLVEWGYCQLCVVFVYIHTYIHTCIYRSLSKQENRYRIVSIAATAKHVFDAGTLSKRWLNHWCECVWFMCVWVCCY